MKIQKSDSNIVFDNILYKYQNAFNNKKLLKKTFIYIYYNKPKKFITKNIYKHLYC